MQICIFDNEKQYFCTLCTCIFHLLTFCDVLVLSSTWNHQFCSCVDDVSIWWQMFSFVFLCPKRCFQFHSILCYLQHTETIKYNNDIKNNAVCRGNQHSFYYGLKLGKHNSPRGLHTPARAIQGKPSTYPPATATETWRPEKNLTKIGAGNLGRNQSRLRLPGPPSGPLITN